MSCHVSQLAVQGALGRIVIDALHAVFLETVDVNQQLSDVVRALTVQTRHHVGDVGQLFRVERAYAYLILRANASGASTLR